MGRLEGKIAIVTGGARGMGASHAKAIAREGGKVVISDVLDGPGAAVAAEIGESAVYCHLDVSRYDHWEAAVRLAEERFGGLNVLVNNAGIVDFGEIGEFSIAAWDRIIAVNLTGMFLGIKAAAPSLERCAPSSIINVASVAGMKGFAGLSGYSASKFGIRGLTRSVALEMAQRNVRANTILPGAIATPMNAGLDVAVYNPMKRCADTSEVSHLVVYLASNESSFTNGAEILVDGGEMAGNGPVNALPN